MVLKVVSLFKRNGSDNWWYRKRIPTDVQWILAMLPNHPRPKGWYQTGHIIVSTGTPGKTLAKAKAVDLAADAAVTLLSSPSWTDLAAQPVTF